MKKIAIFASGSGTNAQAIAEHFKNSSEIEIACILSNKPEAYVLQRAKTLNIPSFTFTRDQFYNSNKVLDILKKKEVDFIVLAGFLWLVPKNLIKQYPNRIINIHPALLPKYGGKGMYGMRVHQAVIDNEEKESGITIHYVNEHYDEGSIIFQARCKVESNFSAEDLARSIHALEYEHFPKIVEQLVLSS